MAKVLVIDDDQNVVRAVRRLLEADGCSVVTAPDGAEGLRLAVEHRPHLVVLDLIVPGLSGRAVLAALLADGTGTPVLVLGAAEAVPTAVRSLGAGAVDFIPKPFEPRELLGRVRGRLGALRAGLAPAGGEIAAGQLRLDPLSRRLYAGDLWVDLSQRECALLTHLMRRAGSVCTRTELLSEVWGYAFDPGSNVVDVTIARLRAKIHGLRIETVRNVGYALRSA